MRKITIMAMITSDGTLQAPVDRRKKLPAFSNMDCL